MTVIDCFSKFAWAVPLTQKSGPRVAAAMRKVIQDNEATLDLVQSDNGTEFMQEFDAVLSEFSTRHIRS